MPGLSPLLLVVVALVAGGWFAAAVWATRRAWRAAGAAEMTVADSERVSALLDAGPAMAMIVAADGSIHGPQRLAARSAWQRCRRAGWGCSGRARLSPLRGRGRAWPPPRGRGGRRQLQPDPAPRRLGTQLPGRRRAGAGRLWRARGRALVHRRHRGGGGGSGAGRAAGAPLRRARRAVGPARGRALPDVASRTRPEACHGQRRLCPRGGGRGCRRCDPRPASS